MIKKMEKYWRFGWNSVQSDCYGMIKEPTFVRNSYSCFLTLIPKPGLYWITNGLYTEYLWRVRHDSRESLLFRTPGSYHFWDLHMLTLLRLFPQTNRGFPDFSLRISLSAFSILFVTITRFYFNLNYGMTKCDNTNSVTYHNPRDDLLQDKKNTHKMCNMQ